MTDNEIVKALECCGSGNGYACVNCPFETEKKCQDILSKHALSLINRQKAEIEKYDQIKTMLDMFWDVLLKIGMAKRKEKPTLEEFAEALQEIIANAKAEAYKEFAERLKKALYSDSCRLVFDSDLDIFECAIDKLLKEMVGDAEPDGK